MYVVNAFSDIDVYFKHLTVFSTGENLVPEVRLYRNTEVLHLLFLGLVWWAGYHTLQTMVLVVAYYLYGENKRDLIQSHSTNPCIGMLMYSIFCCCCCFFCGGGGLPRLNNVFHYYVQLTLTAFSPEKVLLLYWGKFRHIGSEMNFHFIRYLWNELCVFISPSLWRGDIKHTTSFINTVWNENSFQILFITC